MKSRKENVLRLITHVIGETLIVGGSIFVALNIAGVLNSPFSLIIGFFAIVVGAFCQWNPV